jgi:prephenate dehydratase
MTQKSTDPNQTIAPVAAPAPAEPIRVAFQGVPGAYSEEAVRQHFGSAVVSTPFETFDEIFEAVESGAVTYGMQPIENSLAGTVARSYELFLDYDLRIQGEVIVRVHHMLLAPAGTAITDIKRVRSHPQALAQCEKYLRRRGWEPVVWFDTAGSARDLAAHPEPQTASIASALAGQLYQLEALDRNIEDEPFNFTRFFIIGRGDPPAPQRPKTSIMFTFLDRPGALYECLSEFAVRGINLPWQYWFYLDFEGHFQDERCATALLGLLRHAATVKILGSYSAAIQPKEGAAK